MQIHNILGKILAAGLVAFVLQIGSSETADAGICEGTVVGLSSNYNRKRGTGFLAVRSSRSTKSRIKGELFNGDEVVLDAKRGNWYKVDHPNVNGWAWHRYISTDCYPNNP